MREIKFRAFDKEFEEMVPPRLLGEIIGKGIPPSITGWYEWMQYTGLKDKNGKGLIEVYEGDIIRESSVVGNIYETDQRETDLVIPKIGTKAWKAAYKEAVARGFDYAE